jgi:hypothetical protein
MDRGRRGKERKGKETDICPLTIRLTQELELGVRNI